MFTYYFFLKDMETKEEKLVADINFLGEIGQRITYKGRKYVILDYAWEYV